MKKIYLTPANEVLDCEIETSILTGSGVGPGPQPGPTPDPDKGNLAPSGTSDGTGARNGAASLINTSEIFLD